MTEAVRLDGLTKRFAAGAAPAVSNVTLALERGELFCLLGPSGCGKTTLLRLLGGYIDPDAGAVWIGGRDRTREPPERRGVGMVFQNYALFPHLTARENVAFGLRVRKVEKSDRARRVESVLDWVGLSAEERDRRPANLSGGQQQRVALARALVIEPEVLVLDEPFANLDRQLRERLREELRAIQRKSGLTTILVTHDQEEALSLADRIGVMRAGRVIQTSRPEEAYERPATPFVARFLGDANVLAVAAVEGERIRVEGGIILENARLGAKPGDLVLARPEHVVVTAGASAKVISITYQGSDALVDLEVDGGVRIRARARAHELADVTTGASAAVTISAERVWRIPNRDEDESRAR
jgi:ABC-type Fe3+/spermidine/putrescine transport system ATPase subunit